MSHTADSTLKVLRPPYRRFEALIPEELGAFETRPGSAILSQLEGRALAKDLKRVEERPGGVSLVLILPRTTDLLNDPSIWELVSRARPHAILPFHGRPVEDDVAQVLRKPPEDVPVAVTEYLRWRGIRVDSDTTRLVRRTLELSADVSSVTALSRGLYLSRRALGRRFANRGLPVPSHWLQFGRVLRFALRLQNSNQSIFSVACNLGYADGFAASNQMHRLIGFRPTEARACLGWEWIMEAWLRREAESGSLTPNYGAAEAPRVVNPPTKECVQPRRQRRRAAG